MMKIRKLVYRLGFRPKSGSIFYSPSMSMIVDFKKSFEDFES